MQDQTERLIAESGFHVDGKNPGCRTQKYCRDSGENRVDQPGRSAGDGNHTVVDPEIGAAARCSQIQLNQIQGAFLLGGNGSHIQKNPDIILIAHTGAGRSRIPVRPGKDNFDVDQVFKGDMPVRKSFYSRHSSVMDQHAHVIKAFAISPEQKKRVFQGLNQCGTAKAAYDQSCEGLGLHIGGRRADQDTVIDSFSQSDQFFDDGFKVFFVAGFAAEDIFHLIPDGSRFRIFDKIRKMIQEIFTEKQLT